MDELDEVQKLYKSGKVELSFETLGNCLPSSPQEKKSHPLPPDFFFTTASQQKKIVPPPKRFIFATSPPFCFTSAKKIICLQKICLPPSQIFFVFSQKFFAPHPKKIWGWGGREKFGMWSNFIFRSVPHHP